MLWIDKPIPKGSAYNFLKLISLPEVIYTERGHANSITSLTRLIWIIVDPPSKWRTETVGCRAPAAWLPHEAQSMAILHLRTLAHAVPSARNSLTPSLLSPPRRACSLLFAKLFLSHQIQQTLLYPHFHLPLKCWPSATPHKLQGGLNSLVTGPRLLYWAVLRPGTFLLSLICPLSDLVHWFPQIKVEWSLPKGSLPPSPVSKAVDSPSTAFPPPLMSRSNFQHQNRTPEMPLPVKAD